MPAPAPVPDVMSVLPHVFLISRLTDTSSGREGRIRRKRMPGSSFLCSQGENNWERIYVKLWPYFVSVAPTCVFAAVDWPNPRLVFDWSQLFRADTIQQLPKTEQDIDRIMKIINDMVKKMFLEKNEEVYMIPKKFDYILDQTMPITITSWQQEGAGQ